MTCRRRSSAERFATFFVAVWTCGSFWAIAAVQAAEPKASATKQEPRVSSSDADELPNSQPIGVGVELKARTTAVPAKFETPLPAPSPATTGSPVGEWSRELGPLKQRIVIAPGVIRIDAEITDEEQRIKCELTADYSVNSDGLVYGALGGVRITPLAGNLTSDEITEFAVVQQSLFDQPFSLRWRVVDDVLVIKDVKFGGSGLGADDESYGEVVKLYVAGTYERSSPPNSVRP